MKVRQILQDKADSLYTVRPDETVGTLARVLRTHNIGATVVRTGGGEVMGVISERDIVQALVEHGPAALSVQVSEMMSRKTITCSAEDSLRQAMEKMNKYNIRHLPVEDDGRLIGMISVRDVVRHLIAEADMEVAVLKDFATISRTTMAMR